MRVLQAWVAQGLAVLLTVSPCLPALAAPGDPPIAIQVQAGPSPPPAVLVLDQNRRWQGEAQERFKPQDSHGANLDWKTWLRPEVVGGLTYAQRGQLLRDPARLLASSRAGEIFVPRQFLLLEPSNRDERVSGTYIDLDLGLARRVLSGPEREGDQGRDDLIATVAPGADAPKLAVVANPDSHLYHKVECQHLSPRSAIENFPSLFVAEANGYRACGICFAESNRLMTQDGLERELGKALSAQIESEYRVNQEVARLERVNRVGRALLERNPLADNGYRFVVLDSDEVNAFAVPTGPLYITTGLLDVVESDAELAGILGHELAHAELHHTRKQYEQLQQMSWLALLATVATGSGWAWTVSNFFGLLLSRGYSREFEMEADRQGLWYAYGAGYAPDDFKMTLQKFKDLESVRPRGGIAWFHTHPSSDDRLAEVDLILERIEPLSLVLEEVGPEDPGLTAYLKAHGSEFIDNPVELVEFLGAYRALKLPERAGSGPIRPDPARPSPPPDSLPDLK